MTGTTELFQDVCQRVLDSASHIDRYNAAVEPCRRVALGTSVHDLVDRVTGRPTEAGGAFFRYVTRHVYMQRREVA